MINFFLTLAKPIKYSLAASELTISGEGIINQKGIRSKGSFSKITNVIIKEGPTEIDGNSFTACDSLKQIFISSTVEKIGDCAFRWCSVLEIIEVDKANAHFCNDNQYILYSKVNSIICI